MSARDWITFHLAPFETVGIVGEDNRLLYWLECIQLDPNTFKIKKWFHKTEALAVDKKKNKKQHKTKEPQALDKWIAE